MKKAYLVTFKITTRVVVDLNSDPQTNDHAWNKVVSEACDKLYDESPKFADNVTDVSEDTEYPYEAVDDE